MKQAFVGFDSAWAGRNKGAIAYVIFQGDVLQESRSPQSSLFHDAAQIIRELQRECHDVLVAIDQPIIVPNYSSSRPVDRVAGSLMGRLRSGVQPANRSKTAMFGDKAPIWKFIDDIGASLDFEAAETASGQTHLIEVYPALALPTLEPEFMERKSAARYDPTKPKNFCLADWQQVCETVHPCAADFGLDSMSRWAKDMAGLASPKKSHQDEIDAMTCLIVALQWRRKLAWHEVSAIGDLETGYMVTPTSHTTRNILQDACGKRNVSFYCREAEEVIFCCNSG